jgi:hypothetical protein
MSTRLTMAPQACFKCGWRPAEERRVRWSEQRVPLRANVAEPIGVGVAGENALLTSASDTEAATAAAASSGGRTRQVRCSVSTAFA